MLEELHRRLGVPADYAERRGLQRFHEPAELVGVGTDVFGRRQRMAPPAARAWRRMRRAARRAGVSLQMVSAFRSVDYQADVIERKLAQGRTIAEVLTVNTAPGYSEHHTGCALDLTTEGCAPLEEEFEQTEAFRWLARHAGRYGFRMTYPRDNPWGVVYEPWHWAWTGEPGEAAKRA